MDYRDVPHSRSLSTKAPFGLHREFIRAVPRTPTMREFCKASLFLSRVAAFRAIARTFLFHLYCAHLVSRIPSVERLLIQRDPVILIARAPEVPPAQNEVFNVGADTPYSILELAEEISRAFKKAVEARASTSSE
jgi:hypothetical protein